MYGRVSNVHVIIHLPAQALEELRRESAERQATLQEEINRLKVEKDEVSQEN